MQPWGIRYESLPQNTEQNTIYAHTPLDKLLTNLEKCKSESKLAVLIATGSFNPIHKMHVHMFELAKKKLEKDGYKVIAGFVSPSHDLYVEKKLSILGEHFIPAYHRVEMIKIALQSSDWLDCCTWECGQKKFESFPRVTNCLSRFIKKKLGTKFKGKIFFVCGSDLITRAGIRNFDSDVGIVCIARKGWKQIDKNVEHHQIYEVKYVETEAENMSSTMVRQLIQEGKSVDHLIEGGVEQYLKNYFKK